MGWITVSKDTQVLIPGTYACYLRRQGDLAGTRLKAEKWGDYPRLSGGPGMQSQCHQKETDADLTAHWREEGELAMLLWLGTWGRSQGPMNARNAAPKAGTAKRQILPQILQREIRSANTLIWDYWSHSMTLASRCKRMNLFVFEPSDLCCFNPSVCGNLLHTHRKTNKQGSSGTDHRYLWRIRDLPEQQTIWGICYVGLFAWGKGMWREMRPVTWRVELK